MKVSCLKTRRRGADFPPASGGDAEHVAIHGVGELSSPMPVTSFDKRNLRVLLAVG